jgi:hypothetical protein
MRLFVSLLLFFVIAGALPAQTAEMVHELGKDGLKLTGRVVETDPKTKVDVEDGKSLEMPAKRFLVKLLGGKSYRLTMRSKEIDSFLVIQDAAGRQLDYDDDSGGGQDAALTIAMEAGGVRLFRRLAVSGNPLARHTGSP